MSNTLDRAKDVVQGAVESALRQGFLNPMLVVSGGEGDIYIFPIMESIAPCLREIGEEMAVEEASLQQAFLMTEALLESDLPTAIEGILIEGVECNTGRTNVSAFEMLRDRDGNLIDLVKIQNLLVDCSKATLLAPFIDSYRRARRRRCN